MQCLETWIRRAGESQILGVKEDTRKCDEPNNIFYGRGDSIEKLERKRFIFPNKAFVANHIWDKPGEKNQNKSEVNNVGFNSKRSTYFEHKKNFIIAFSMALDKDSCFNIVEWASRYGHVLICSNPSVNEQNNRKHVTICCEMSEKNAVRISSALTKYLSGLGSITNDQDGPLHMEMEESQGIS